MREYPIVSFLAGFIITTMVVVVIYFAWLLLGFNLVGGESLEKIGNESMELVVIAFFILLAITLRALWGNSNRYQNMGRVSVAVIVFLLAVGYMYRQNYMSETFDKTVWDKSNTKPYVMAATLYRQKKLEGLSKNQVYQMLESNTSNNLYERDEVQYNVQGGLQLIIHFDNNIVNNVQLRRPYLGV